METCSLARFALFALLLVVSFWSAACSMSSRAAAPAPGAALAPLHGSRWTGKHELWTDPAGNTARIGACTLRFDPDGMRYTWELDGKQQSGELWFTPDGARWSDTFHQPTAADCRAIAGAWGLCALNYEYPAPTGPDWGWRTQLTQRPSGELVLQMTNITPWGEEGRAVRMVFTRTP